MSIEDIQQFLQKKVNEGQQYVKITFKKREPVFGLFVMDAQDFKELKAKNFWRIVAGKHVNSYQKSRNIDLTRIFSGSEFLRLVPYAETFE